MNLYDYKGLALLKDSSPETIKTKLHCMVHDIPYKMYLKNQTIDLDFVPVGGSVEWCQKQLGYNVVPDYYPSWLDNYISRDIWYADKWDFLKKRIFIKPADKYKRFTGFVTTGTYSKKRKPPFMCSSLVNFEDEFRYYISNGEVVSADWYWGKEKTILAPEISFSHIIPNGFCGAVDIGILDNGEYELIEVQHPFACGWYGDDIKVYIQWCIDGWQYINKR
jgi:hypothetical protein